MNNQLILIETETPPSYVIDCFFILQFLIIAQERRTLWALIQRMSEEQDNNTEPTELLARVMKLDR